jgi:hypothetical protein
MGQTVGPNSVRPRTSAAGPYRVFTGREQVAELIGAHPMDAVFTSRATESNNAALAPALRTNPTKRHIVTSQAEHSSVLNYCMALEKSGTPLLLRRGKGVVVAWARRGSGVVAAWVRRVQGVGRTASLTRQLTAKAC